MADERRLVPRSPDGSPPLAPVRKKAKGEDDDEFDPDELMDSMLQAQSEADMQGAPPWAVALQRTLQLEIRRSSDQVGVLSARLGHLEAERERDRKEYSDRLDSVEAALHRLQQSAPSDAPKPHTFARMPPPVEVPTNQPKGFAQNKGDTDYNHIVVGEWEDGTPRAEIETRLASLFAAHQPTLQVKDIVVYGARGSIGHVFLDKLYGEAAFARYLTIRENMHEKHRAAGPESKLLWFSASKPLAIRRQNKRTMLARDMMEGLLPEKLEVEWKRGVIWWERHRVAASLTCNLRTHSDHKITSLAPDPYQATEMYHFNISTIAVLSGKTREQVEGHLFKAQRS